MQQLENGKTILQKKYINKTTTKCQDMTFRPMKLKKLTTTFDMKYIQVGKAYEITQGKINF